MKTPIQADLMIDSRNVAMSQIEPPRINLRTEPSKESIQELKKSIQELGMMNPIILHDHGKTFEIVAGFRRWTVAKELGWSTIQARVGLYSTNQIYRMRYDENNQRLDNNPVEEACFFRDIIEKHNWKAKQIAKSLRKSTTYISDRLAILRYPSEMLTAVETGAIGLSVAREIWRVRDETAMLDMVRIARDGGMTAIVAKQWADDYLKKKDLNHAENETEPYPAPTGVTHDGHLQRECDSCGTMKTYDQLTSILICRECLS
jgi:ParB/RepB/Spo0J family partition protein